MSPLGEVIDCELDMDCFLMKGYNRRCPKLS